jgi:dTDP-4-dehydrorhamnose reductase
MERPRILVIGKNGQVGWELCRTMAPIGDVMAVDYPEVDLMDRESVREIVRQATPNVIVNAAAYTAVDKAESDTERAWKINATGPGVLADEARRGSALLVHYSTDYVYDGTKATPYVEEDSPAPLSAYGKSKADGDKAIGESGCQHLVFRLCWVYGARGQNFMRTMMRLASEREQLRVVADQVGSPTWARMIAGTTALAVAQVLKDANREKYNGVYHLAATGDTSWHGFAQAIVDLMPDDAKKCKEVQPITTVEYPLPARRPARSVLSCAKLERVFGLKLPDWRESLAMVMEQP